MTALAPPDHEDTTDFADADRGFLGALTPGRVTADDGRVVWDNDAYSFLQGPCPDTAHPGLWRQSRLAAKQGLFEVVEGVYQVRGLDLSNMTLVEGDRGVVVIDPLHSTEAAAAALALYREHRGDRPVTALIYTHCHVDHFGGARGVLPYGHDPVPVLAPAGFLEHAASENVYAGTAMNRRAVYMYGSELPKGPAGQIGCGLGQTVSTGAIALIRPTVSVTRTGQDETLDGVRIVFQLTPGTEAPAEMNFVLPGKRVLCMAENATHTMHNILTLRGAQVRDARQWAQYLNESLVLFGNSVDVVIASHHWPTWGRENIHRLLAHQRDLYAYLHDQTLRLLNQGMTGSEIAEELRLPPALERLHANRGYYGSLCHNVKAVYQRYMGWFDGNPAHLWEHPPAEEARRYVDCLGGVDATVAKAGEYADAGDLRFAATLLNHAVFADPGHTTARGELAAVYVRLGHGCENGPWRNFYLMGAKELRDGISPTPTATPGPDLTAALTVDQLIDSLAIRVNGPRAWDTHLTIDWRLTDEHRTWHLTLSNGALTHYSTQDGRPNRHADLTLTLTRPELQRLLAGGRFDGIEHEGDLKVVTTLVGLLDGPDRDFAIVTP
ncbi:alkyl/aryl-sulfatase [Streptomyces sp. NPDC088354]|uniref:alkyl/aryl-sulfatase n=1 Tax=unclassified Streptomyces TaxID=2593676 RepID=UPI0029B1B978|nr:alkyl sulfatase dimerization domain-containing protein [Streptomyces sp. MI02-7b]MDX3074312.1 alkyl sulfatase dimerization domain-containing protein [Streptomyces sp. MI02-7b]